MQKSLVIGYKRTFYVKQNIGLVLKDLSIDEMVGA